MWPSQRCRNTSRNRNVISDLQLFQLCLALAACRRTGEGVTPSPDSPLQRKTFLSPDLPSSMPGSRSVFILLRYRTARVTLHCTEQSTTDHPKCTETPEMTNGTFLMSGSQSLGVMWMRTAQWPGSGRNYSTYTCEKIWRQYTEGSVKSGVESKTN